MPKRKHNPNSFTIDEAQTATLAYTEGTPYCKRAKGNYIYPTIRVGSCVKDDLKPISRLYNRKISPSRARKQYCEPEDFPPEGKGFWIIDIHKQEILRLSPLIPKRHLQKWEERWREKGCPQIVRPPRKRAKKR